MDPPPLPTHSSSLDSTWSNTHNDMDNFTGVGPPGLWSMLNAASRFDDPDDDSEETESSGSQTPSYKDVAEEIVPHHALQAMTPMARLAQLTVNSYNISTASFLEDAPFPGEEKIAPPKGPDPGFILSVLQTEFGPLAREGEEEVLVRETDAALLFETTVLGTVHLTSHRVTFHASLLSTRPDLAPSAQIIKSGPFVAHRSGFHRRRRRWLELSHDMISLYKNSSDEARSRPIRSTLLSSVVRINDIDHEQPTTFQMIVEKENGPETVRLEFDTQESTAEWHREMRQAIFLYRQRQSEVLYGSGSPTSADKIDSRKEVAGVRICIPLHRVESCSSQPFMDFGKLVSLSINNDTPDGDSNKPPSLREFKFLIIKNLEGPILEQYVAEAKTRRDASPEKVFPPTDVVTIDFGPLAFAEIGESEVFAKGDENISAKETRMQATERRMKKMFALDKLLDVFVIPAWRTSRICSAGYLLISDAYICFWSKSYTSLDIKYRFATRDVNVAYALPSTFFRHYSIGLEVKGRALVHFAVEGQELRDSIVKRINAARDRASSAPAPHLPRMETVDLSDLSSKLATSSLSDTIYPSRPSFSDTASPESIGTPSRSSEDYGALATATLAPLSHALDIVKGAEIPISAFANFAKPINFPKGVLRGMSSRHFVCLSIGSRGDVQPYIALCKGLIAEGHRATIVTHSEYKDWVEGFGIAHRTAGGDPGALMKLSVEHSMFSPQFFKESIGKFRGWLDDLLMDSWQQCQDADVLIESPSAMAGVHIAEALNIPYIRAFTMPWTRTTAYPHAFLSPPVELSGTFNYSTSVRQYILDGHVGNVLGQVNRWRKKTLNIPRTDTEKLAQTKIPFIYNFSPSVVPKPLDWADFITVSGYWFLDNPDLEWSPPLGLVEFIAKAKQDRIPIVYIGFGSIVVPHPHAMTRSIIKGVLKAGVRAIISKGWSDRMSQDKDEEVPMPPECFSLDKVPHDWLFPQIDAALHHGGAGTTGASLRAGIPTLIKPWFGDQFFWSSRVAKLGAGLRVDNLGSAELSQALKKATSDRIMKEKASAVGEKIRSEDGVFNAIQAIYTYMERAAHRNGI